MNIASVMKHLLISLIVAAIALPSNAKLVDPSYPDDRLQSENNRQGYISFESSEASWLRPPRFNFNREQLDGISANTYKVVAKIYVDKNGNITDCQLIKISNNNTINKFLLKSIKQAKLKPFIYNKHPVKAVVTLPIEVKIA